MTDPTIPIRSRRCKKCFYILDHLDSRTCPECGEPFDPDDDRTYVDKPPFVWWTYWLPAFLLSGVGGGILWCVLLTTSGFTVATTFVVPIAIGAVLGYGSKVTFVRMILLALLTIILAIAFLASGGFVGGFCALIVGALALIPVLFGVFLGWLLRQALANSNFSQRDYLRSFFIQLMFAAIPIIATICEGRHSPAAPVSVTTSQVIHVPVMQAWHGIQFFEEVRRPVPWLLLASPSLRPVYTSGHSEKVGDLKTCHYQRGKLIKQITEAIPGKRLAFRVVEQDRIENDGAKLIDGSFDLEPIDDGKSTRVRLTTRYIPLLYPRPAYQWAEAWAIHTLHGHVLAGMSDKAQEKVR